MSNFEKLDEKYGDPYLRKLAEETFAAKQYYEMYLDSKKRAHYSEIECAIMYAISLVLIIVSFWVPAFLISTAIFLIMATRASLDVRIERLWSSKFMSDIFDAIRLFNLEEKVTEMEKHVAQN